jgi:hypothetical protein
LVRIGTTATLLNGTMPPLRQGTRSGPDLGPRRGWQRHRGSPPSPKRPSGRPPPERIEAPSGDGAPSSSGPTGTHAGSSARNRRSEPGCVGHQCRRPDEYGSASHTGAIADAIRGLKRHLSTS